MKLCAPTTTDRACGAESAYGLSEHGLSISHAPISHKHNLGEGGASIPLALRGTRGLARMPLWGGTWFDHPCLHGPLMRCKTALGPSHGEVDEKVVPSEAQGGGGARLCERVRSR